MNVLLLNASLEPLQTISVRRAVHLLLAEKVEAVTSNGYRLRTVSTIFTVPFIVRLSYYVNAPRKDVVWSRKAVLERDNWECIYCGIQVGERHNGRVYHKTDFTLEHIIPRSRGGGNTWGNTACACFACNQRKANRMPHEAGMKLRFEPKIPRSPMLVIRGQIPREWAKYLSL